jgi:cytochrome c biogenesis protein CcmG, thiol:disulfide interchange protein DsbE
VSGIARRRVLMLAPLGVSAVLGLAFWRMLDRMQAGKFDPHAINNPLIGKKLPDFNLASGGDRPGFTSADLRAAAAQKPVLVNFFWSQCIPCMEEADIIGGLANEGIPVWGVACKDQPANLTKYLNRFGNPYQRIGDDRSGRVLIDWGVDGFPESFLVDRSGIVRWHIGGPLDANSVENNLRPALQAMA